MEAKLSFPRILKVRFRFAIIELSYCLPKFEVNLREFASWNTM